MHQAWELLDREVAYACPGFEIEREEVRLPNGVETDFDFLVEPPSVVVLPFVDDETIVTIREWREAVKRTTCGLPTGTIERDDGDVLAAAARELREETGYEAGDLEHLLTVEPANGVAAIEHEYVLARDCEPTAEQTLEPDETISVEPCAFDDLLARAMAGDVRDGRTLLGVLHHQLQRSDTLTDDTGKPGA